MDVTPSVGGVKATKMYGYNAQCARKRRTALMDAAGQCIIDRGGGGCEKKTPAGYWYRGEWIIRQSYKDFYLWYECDKYQNPISPNLEPSWTGECRDPYRYSDGEDIDGYWECDNALYSKHPGLVVGEPFWENSGAPNWRIDTSTNQAVFSQYEYDTQPRPYFVFVGDGVDPCAEELQARRDFATRDVLEGTACRSHDAMGGEAYGTYTNSFRYDDIACEDSCVFARDGLSATTAAIGRA